MSADTASSGRIGHRVRVALVARRMTVTALAKAIGIPYRTLQSYLANDSRFPASAVVEIAKKLDVSVDFLLLGEAAVLDRVAVRLAISELEGIWPNNFRLEGLNMEDIVRTFVSAYHFRYLDLRGLGYVSLEPGLATAIGPAMPLVRSVNDESEVE